MRYIGFIKKLGVRKPTLSFTFIIGQIFVLTTFVLPRVYAQLPVIKANATAIELRQSEMYQTFHPKYDFLIAYTSQSYWWSDRKNYVFLGLKNGKWEKGSYTSSKGKNEKWTKPKIKVHFVNGDSALAVINLIGSNGFYLLNRDSLNISKRAIRESERADFVLEPGEILDSVSTNISDGVNYRFEVVNKGTFTIIESYEPQFYLEYIPEIKQREVFLNCMKLFLKKFYSL